MLLEENVFDSTATLSQRFMMLIQALSGIRGLTSIKIDNSTEQDLLQNALDVLNQNLDFERCSVFLLKNDEELHCIASRDRSDADNSGSDEEIKSHIFMTGQGIVGQAAKTGELYHCQNSKKDKNYLSIIQPGKESEGCSLICMPIMISDELLGVLNVTHPEPDFFHPWQEHVIHIHANILAQMIYNHRLMKDMATQVNNRTKELQLSLEDTESLKSKYKALSIIDDLTQIYNRRYFFSEVPAALARALRHRQPLSLLFIDLDHFKKINDNYGHEFGDKVLKSVAAILSKQSRKGDILSRMGGEEFALVVPNTEIEGIHLLAERIKDAVSAMSWDYKGTPFGITLSIGISELRHSKDNAPSSLNHINEISHMLVREADEALYHCKDNGRNMITFYRQLQEVIDEE